MFTLFNRAKADKPFAVALDAQGRQVPVVLLHPDSASDGGNGGGSRVASQEALGPFAVTDQAAIVADEDQTRRELRFRNSGDNPLALGPAGVTLLNAAIILEPGDMFVETTAPHLEWQAVSAADTTIAISAFY